MNLVANEPKKTAKKKVGQTAKNKKSGTVGKKQGSKEPRSNSNELNEIRVLKDNLKKMRLPTKTVQDREVREFKAVMDKITSNLSAHIGNGTVLNNLFTGEHGSSSKLAKNDSVYREKPEELTKRFVIEPLLKLLGYEDIAYETSIGANNKQCDYALILDKDKLLHEQTVIIVEAKAMLIGINREINVQLSDYLVGFNSKSIFTPYFGILTDGLIWELHSLNEDRNTIKVWKVDLQPLLMWSLLRSQGDNPKFPMATYRKFRTVFRKENIQTYANCLRLGVKMTVPDQNNKFVHIDDVVDEPVRRKTKLNNHPGALLTSANILMD